MIGPVFPPEQKQAKEEEEEEEEEDDDDDDDVVTGGTEKKKRTDPSLPWVISENSSISTSQRTTRNKRLKSVAKLNPWIDWHEFEHVGQSLISSTRTLQPYLMNRNRNIRQQRRQQRNRWQRQQQNEVDMITSSSSQMLHQSLQRISVWKVRMGNRLSHAVESTYQLGMCLWRDWCSCCFGGRSCIIGASSAVEGLRLSYSCAVLRTINGLADSLQQQRATAQSVAMLCNDLGIPTWLVDIRHEATHNQMPSLTILRLAATTLLEYFFHDYWEPLFPSTTTSTTTTTATMTSTSSSATASFSCTEASSTTLLEHLLAYKEQQSKTIATNEKKSSSSSPKKRKKNTNNNNSTNNKKKSTNNKYAFSNNHDGDHMRESDDDGEEEMYLNGSNTDFWAGSACTTASILGTNKNRFAALMMDTPKKKKKKKNDNDNNNVNQNQQESKPHNNNSQSPPPTTKTTKKELSAHHHAKQFVKKGMNHGIEEAYRVAILFLVWGGGGGGGGESVDGDPKQQQGGGALIPPKSSIKFPPTQEGVKKVRHLYSILLTVIGTEWPGFLKCLMIHLVDCILSLEQQQQQQGSSPTDQENDETTTTTTTTTATTAETAEVQRQLFFLESWVRYLVSSSFLVVVLPAAEKAIPKDIRSPNKPAPWQYLEMMWYPLNSLCDRLQQQQQQQQQSNTSETTTSTSKRIADFFFEILGPDRRIANFGLVPHQEYSFENSNEVQTLPSAGTAVAPSPSGSRSEIVVQSSTSHHRVPDPPQRAETTSNSVGGTSSKQVGNALSLDDMESMLFSGTTTSTDMKADSKSGMAETSGPNDDIAKGSANRSVSTPAPSPSPDPTRLSAVASATPLNHSLAKEPSALKVSNQRTGGKQEDQQMDIEQKPVPSHEDPSQDQAIGGSQEYSSSNDECMPSKPRRRRRAWVRCTVWEPCAIGSLPGYPFSA